MSGCGPLHFVHAWTLLAKRAANVKLLPPKHLLVRQRGTDTLDSLARKTIAGLARVEHEILGCRIGTFQRDAVLEKYPGTSMASGSMLDRVVETDNGRNAATGGVLARQRRLGDNLLALLLADLTHLVVNGLHDPRSGLVVKVFRSSLLRLSFFLCEGQCPCRLLGRRVVSEGVEASSSTDRVRVCRTLVGTSSVLKAST